MIFLPHNGLAHAFFAYHIGLIYPGEECCLLLITKSHSDRLPLIAEQSGTGEVAQNLPGDSKSVKLLAGPANPRKKGWEGMTVLLDGQEVPLYFYDIFTKTFKKYRLLNIFDRALSMERHSIKPSGEFIVILLLFSIQFVSIGIFS